MKNVLIVLLNLIKLIFKLHSILCQTQAPHARPVHKYGMTQVPRPDSYAKTMCFFF